MTTVRKKKKHKSDAKASEQMRNWLTKQKNTKCTQPVSFQTFSKLVENLPDIAFQIQVTEIGAQNQTLDQCAYWFYNAFYSDPTVRSKFEIKLRPCPSAIKEKLLQLPAVALTDGTTRETESFPVTADGVEVSVSKCGRFLFPVTFATFERYIDKERLIPSLVRKQFKDKAQRKAFLADKTKCRSILQKYYNSFYIFPSKRRLDKFHLKEAPSALQEQLLKGCIPLDELAAKTVGTNLDQSLKNADSSEAANPQESISSIVSFDVFEKYIKNIYDIAWRLKLNEPEYAYKGFEDCAFAYYLAFYLTPEFRDRFPYELAPCTSAMKNRILALPNPNDVKTLLEMRKRYQHLPPTQVLEPHMVNPVVEQFPVVEIPEVEHEVLVPLAEDATNKKTPINQQPKATQPVTFGLFKRYIRNLDKIVDEMQRCEEYKDKSNEECALEYFKAFYTTPQIRKKFEYEIKPCPAKVREKLLTLPDETPIAMENTSAVDSDGKENAIDLSDEQKFVTVNGITYIYSVTFETFMRYINYHELRKQLVNANAKTKLKRGDNPSVMQLFKRFYHSFYIDQRLRTKFNYNFNAAPANLRHKLMELAIPMAREDQQPTNELPNTKHTSMEQSRTKATEDQAEHEEQPELEVQSEESEEQPEFEEQLESEQPPEPEKQLQLEEQAEPEDILESEQQVELSEQPECEEQLESNQQLDHEKHLESEQQPVHEKQLEIEEYPEFEEQPEFEEKLESEKQVEFMEQPISEDQLETEQQPEPEEQSGTEQQSEPQELTEPEERVSEANGLPPTTVDINCNSNRNNPNNIVVLSERIMISLQDIKYEFPVSLQTFKRYINYDTLKLELAKSFVKKKHKVDQLLSDERSNALLLRRFYHSFYINSAIRKKFKFNFNAAPVELQEKLLQYAVPLVEVAESAAPQCAFNIDSAVAQQCNQSDTEQPVVQVPPVADVPSITEALDQEMLPQPQHTQHDVPYPVSFNIFSKILQLDDVVKQMQQEPKYAQMSDNECKLTYFKAFYQTPEIREKYTCSIRPCPALLKAKILEIPQLQDVTDHTYSRCSPPDAKSEQSLADLYAARQAELSSMKMENVVEYTPHNLNSYIELRMMCPEKRSLLEKHFIGQKKTREMTTSEKAAPIPEGNAITSTVATTTNAEKETATEAPAKCSTAVPATAEATGAKTSPVDVVETTTTTTTTVETLPTPASTSETTEPANTVAVAAAETTKATSTACGTTNSTTSISVPSSKSLPSTTSVSNAEKGAIVTARKTEGAATASTSVTNAPKTLTIASLSPVPASTLLSKISTDFFAPHGKEHNIKNLMYTSHGLKKTIWLVLSQLSYPEFKTYTGIHGGDSFYEEESVLYRIYSHVITKGNWPINLYVKLSMLGELLHSKGVYIETLELGQFSPKIFDWHELSNSTNFDDIVESDFRKRTGSNIKLSAEVEQFYVRCWTHDQWIHQVPRITAEELNRPIARNDTEAIDLAMLPSTIPVCLIEADETAHDIVEIQDDATTASIEQVGDVFADKVQDSDCPATQLELSLCPPSFVDIESVCPASQAAEGQSDPLLQSSQVAVPFDPVEVKREPVKFLNMMRFVINSEQSGEFQCESISTEEQVINLDNDEDERIAKELACFEISKSNVASSLPLLSPCQLNAALDNQFQDIMHDVNLSKYLSDDMQMALANQLIATEKPEEAQDQAASKRATQSEAKRNSVAAPPSAVPARAPAVAKKQPRATTSTAPCKRPRLMTDNVPQLRHDFRPLPLSAMVRIETTDMLCPLNREDPPEQELPTTSNQERQHNLMTASQALATDNTLMESSQLQQLLDAPFVNQRQVNVVPMEVDCDSDKNDRATTRVHPVSLPVLHKHIVFSTLERYMYFDSLTTANIAKYQINSLAVGTSYQQALICANGKLCNVYGPLLENLFPHCTPSLLGDLQYLLKDIGEFSYNCRMNLHRETKEDLRTRVLYAFMRAAPPFAHMRLHFENETQEWANCSTINERDSDFIKRKPSCDVRSGIKPEILQRMKEFKSLCYL